MLYITETTKDFETAVAEEVERETTYMRDEAKWSPTR